MARLKIGLAFSFVHRDWLGLKMSKCLHKFREANGKYCLESYSAEICAQ